MTFPGYPSIRESSTARQAPVRPGEELAGKYRVDRVIGAGAMGVVVLAWHIELEQKVAIKFLHAELARNADGAERFRREARSAVRIRSEHVARVLDVGTMEGQGIPFIVMEYLHGRDLARELGTRGPLPISEAARYLLEACDAIGEAHARGIVHRDLKPANLFLAERPSGGQMLKVLDFGISKSIGGSTMGLSITDVATLMGSPGYMSPEQLESSRNVDARSDIWSLGVILYEMVTGVLPFDGESVPQLIRAVIGGRRSPLSLHDDSLVDLEPIVTRCLQQDRAERYQSVAQLCQDLQPFARSITGSPYRVGGMMSTEEPRLSTPPRTLAGTGVVPPPPPAAAPEGAWGRTHGGRHATLRRGIPLAASLGALVAIGVWLARTTPRNGVTAPEGAGSVATGTAVEKEKSVEQVERVAVPLTPFPAPAAVPPAPQPPAAALAAERPASPAAKPSADAVRPPPAAPAPAVAARDVASLPRAQKHLEVIGASREGEAKAAAQARSSADPRASRPREAAPVEDLWPDRARRAAETGSPEPDTTLDDYENPEFGGRE